MGVSYGVRKQAYLKEKFTWSRPWDIVGWNFRQDARTGSWLETYFLRDQAYSNLENMPALSELQVDL